jgi:hypothetical protein
MSDDEDRSAFGITNNASATNANKKVNKWVVACKYRAVQLIKEWVRMERLSIIGEVNQEGEIVQNDEINEFSISRYLFVPLAALPDLSWLPCTLYVECNHPRSFVDQRVTPFYGEYPDSYLPTCQLAPFLGSMKQNNRLTHPKKNAKSPDPLTEFINISDLAWREGTLSQQNKTGRKTLAKPGSELPGFSDTQLPLSETTQFADGTVVTVRPPTDQWVTAYGPLGNTEMIKKSNNQFETIEKLYGGFFRPSHYLVHQNVSKIYETWSIHQEGAPMCLSFLLNPSSISSAIEEDDDNDNDGGDDDDDDEEGSDNEEEKPKKKKKKKKSGKPKKVKVPTIKSKVPEVRWKLKQLVEWNIPAIPDLRLYLPYLSSWYKEIATDIALLISKMENRDKGLIEWGQISNVMGTLNTNKHWSALLKFTKDMRPALYLDNTIMRLALFYRPSALVMLSELQRRCLFLILMNFPLLAVCPVSLFDIVDDICSSYDPTNHAFRHIAPFVVERLGALNFEQIALLQRQSRKFIQSHVSDWEEQMDSYTSFAEQNSIDLQLEHTIHEMCSFGNLKKYQPDGFVLQEKDPLHPNHISFETKSAKKKSSSATAATINAEAQERLDQLRLQLEKQTANAESIDPKELLKQIEAIASISKSISNSKAKPKAKAKPKKKEIEEEDEDEDNDGDDEADEDEPTNKKNRKKKKGNKSPSPEPTKKKKKNVPKLKKMVVCSDSEGEEDKDKEEEEEEEEKDIIDNTTDMIADDDDEEEDGSDEEEKIFEVVVCPEDSDEEEDKEVDELVAQLHEEENKNEEAESEQEKKAEDEDEDEEEEEEEVLSETILRYSIEDKDRRKIIVTRKMLEMYQGFFERNMIEGSTSHRSLMNDFCSDKEIDDVNDWIEVMAWLGFLEYDPVIWDNVMLRASVYQEHQLALNILRRLPDAFSNLRKCPPVVLEYCHLQLGFENALNWCEKTLSYLDMSKNLLVLFPSYDMVQWAVCNQQGRAIYALYSRLGHIVRSQRGTSIKAVLIVEAQVYGNKEMNNMINAMMDSTRAGDARHDSSNLDSVIFAGAPWAHRPHRSFGSGAPFRTWCHRKSKFPRGSVFDFVTLDDVYETDSSLSKFQVVSNRQEFGEETNGSDKSSIGDYSSTAAAAAGIDAGVVAALQMCNAAWFTPIPPYSTLTVNNSVAGVLNSVLKEEYERYGFRIPFFSTRNKIPGDVVKTVTADRQIKDLQISIIYDKGKQNAALASPAVSVCIEKVRPTLDTSPTISSSEGLVMYSGSLNPQVRMRLRCYFPESVASYDRKTGDISVNQCLYLADTGEFVRVSACFIVINAEQRDKNGTLHLYSTSKVKAKDDRAMVFVEARRSSNQVRGSPWCFDQAGHATSCCKLYPRPDDSGSPRAVVVNGGDPTPFEMKTKRFFYPHRHNLYEAEIVKVDSYFGPPVKNIYLLMYPGTTVRDIYTAARLAQRLILFPQAQASDFMLDRILRSMFKGKCFSTNAHYFLAGECYGFMDKDVYVIDKNRNNGQEMSMYDKEIADYLGLKYVGQRNPRSTRNLALRRAVSKTSEELEKDLSSSSSTTPIVYVPLENTMQAYMDHPLADMVNMMFVIDNSRGCTYNIEDIPTNEGPVKRATLAQLAGDEENDEDYHDPLPFGKSNGDGDDDGDGDDTADGKRRKNNKNGDAEDEYDLEDDFIDDDRKVGSMLNLDDMTEAERREYEEAEGYGKSDAEDDEDDEDFCDGEDGMDD